MLNLWPEFLVSEKSKAVKIGYGYLADWRWDDTRSNEEEPAEYVKTDLYITAAFEKIDTDGRETTG